MTNNGPERTLRLSFLLLLSLLALLASNCNCGEVMLGGESDGGPQGDVVGAHGDTGLRPDTGRPLGDTGPGVDSGAQPDTGEAVDSGENEGDTGASLDVGYSGDGGCPAVKCDGLCGPIRDFCSGQVMQCGGCTGGLVCDLDLHLCLQAAKDCTDLGAECGQVRNSCGEHIHCGPAQDDACGDVSQECDRNTHKCVACSNTSCIDMGYECGDVWLGCGPRTNLTHCGDCGTGLICNGLNTCEPDTCTPEPDDPTVCAAAGAECGSVRKGCGLKFAKCGDCDVGSCGARGIGNHCDLPETPDECVAANRTCGSLASACGTQLSCGTCIDPTPVCYDDGAAGSHCGKVCVPATCDTTYAGKCGTGLDEGCTAGKTIDCPCGATLLCSATVPGAQGTCSAPAACAKFTNGNPGDKCSNDPSADFPKGDGSNLACPCNGAGVCVKGGKIVGTGESGTCCVNSITCGNACAKSVQDSCTGADIPCTCDPNSGTHCNQAAQICELDHNCKTYNANGSVGDPCSNGPAFDKNGTDLIACPCLDGSACFAAGHVASGATQGTCCMPDVCPTNTCLPLTEHCSGVTLTCKCDPGNYCKSSVCSSLETCGSYSANGANGDPCSLDPDVTDFPAGDGSGLTCGCTGTATCIKQKGSPTPPDPGTKGVCCVNTQKCLANECNRTKVNDCTGAPIDCTKCTQAGYHCDNPTFTCVQDNGCSAFTNGQVGSDCSNGPSKSFPKGDGSNLQCNCSAPGAQCIGSTQLPDTTWTKGSCCVPDTCAIDSCALITDHCTGQQSQCTCANDPGTHCNSGTNHCDGDRTCATYNANGQVGQACSNGPSFPNGDNPPNQALLTCLCTAGGTVCSNGHAVVPGSGCGTPGSTSCSKDPDCGGGQVCLNNFCATPCLQGSCCQNATNCGGHCDNTKLTNDCTGALLACNCGGGQYCDATADGTCHNDLGCGSYTTGLDGQPCSSSPNTTFPRWPYPPGSCTTSGCSQDTTGQTCGCAGSRVCSVAGSPYPHQAGVGELGACCTNAKVCGTKCNNTLIHNDCTGTLLTCNCGGSQYCDAGSDGTCQPYFTCATYSANGNVGDVCSNGNDPTDFPRYPGDTTGRTCSCKAGNCYKSNVIVSGATKGNCCTPPTPAAGNIGDPCTPVHDNCTNTDIPQPCKSGNFCDSGTNKCVANYTCATFNANGNVGDVCSNGNDPTDFPRYPGDPTGRTCNCKAGNCYRSNVIVSGATEGNCCTPPTPAAGNIGDPCTPVHDNCTNTDLPQPCKSGNYCKNNFCAAWETCGTYNANGNVGNVCSNGNDPTDFPRYTGDGTGLTCSCKAGNCYKSNAIVSGAAEGNCCTPPTPAAGNIGDACTLLHDPCTNTDLPQPCKTGNYCKAGFCALDETCASYNANGAVGQVCSNGNDPTDFPRYTGDPTGLTCSCTAGNCYKSYAIVSGATEGNCCTPPVPAQGNIGDPCTPVHDNCTNTDLPQTCKANEYCKANFCALYETCSTYSANGGANDVCSNGNDPTDFPRYPADPQGLTCLCGGSFKCINKASHTPVSGATEGHCCTLTVSDCGGACPNGSDCPDGCGGILHCGG